MGLLLSHPEIAYRSCSECQRWHFDPKSGRLQKRWKKDSITGERALAPIARKPGDKLPCWDCPKCDGSDVRNPAVGRAAELSERNWKALRFYFQQKAVGGPVDAIVRRNCGMIEWLLEQHRNMTGRIMVDLLKMRNG